MLGSTITMPGSTAGLPNNTSHVLGIAPMPITVKFWCIRTELLAFYFLCDPSYPVTGDPMNAAAITQLHVDNTWRSVKWGTGEAEGQRLGLGVCLGPSEGLEALKVGVAA